jgi:phenylalanyl-tRNA synthetase alpha chain
MSLDLEELKSFEKKIKSALSLQELYSIRVEYFGKKGLIANINKGLKDLDVAKRADLGRQLQDIRKSFEALYESKQEELKEATVKNALKSEQLDITLPGFPFCSGTLHPLTSIYNRILDIFVSMGFEIAFGPEVELDFYNFESLNIPKNHPARDMQDTFYITEDILLRTHTSPVQIRVMERQGPPIKIVAPGKVYRRDSDVTHTPMFHQLEGLYIDKNVSFAQLKGTLTIFLNRLFSANTNIRFRASYFPFTEPSAEVDIGCVVCKGSGCRVCKNSGWLEILGCGLVDPEVFKSAGIDSEKYSGFAFGLGIERVAMLLYGIDDIRLFFENNLKFLKQF